MATEPVWKTVPITLWVQTEIRVPEDWDEEAIRFFVEENHCIENEITKLAEDIESRPGECRFCAVGGELVGHVDCEKLRASVEAMTKDP
jgi:hypothetical protein